jgi:hypothetical protein
MASIAGQPAPQWLYVRWLLAPFVGVAAAVAAFMIVGIAAVVLVGKAALDDVPNAEAAIACAIVVASPLATWAWIASVIVPRQHRLRALFVFSSPLVLIAPLLALDALANDPGLKRVSIAVGVWLACAAIGVIAVRRTRRPQIASDLAAVGPSVRNVGGVGSGRTTEVQQSPLTPAQAIGRAAAVTLKIVGWLLLSIAVLVLVVALGVEGSFVSRAMFGLLLGGMFTLLGHGILVGAEQMSYRASRTRWTTLPAEIVHSTGPRIVRHLTGNLFGALAMFCGVLVMLVDHYETGNLQQTAILAIVGALTLGVAYAGTKQLGNLVRGRACAREISMNKVGLRIVQSSGDEGRTIPWRDIRKVTSTTMAFRYNRTYYLVLDVAAPEHFGLKPMRRFEAKFLRAEGNVAIPLSGYLEYPHYIVADIEAFRARYAKVAGGIV